MGKAISVAIADDHGVGRETLVSWLQAKQGINIAGSVANAQEAVDLCVDHRPDVMLMDIDMPGQDAFEAARIIRSRSPETRVIFLSAFMQDSYIDSALAAKASGYVVKTESPEAVLGAILAVASGATYFSPQVQLRIVIDASGVRLREAPRSRASTLTARELDILRYVAKGLATKEIAQATNISDKTVERHVANLMLKLSMHSRVELARFAIQEGLANV